MKNKAKILNSALKLFNQKGIVNVRLQHISDHSIVSLGNIAYHYPNKESILIALYQKLTKKQKELLTEYRIVPLFENIDRLIHYTYQLQQEYIFFYKDTLEIVRAYPAIGQAHQKHIKSQVDQIKIILDFNIARGALKKGYLEEVISQLALQIWMTMDFLVYQHSVRTNQSLDLYSYKIAIWNLFKPFFTNMGIMEYHQMLQKPYKRLF